MSDTYVTRTWSCTVRLVVDDPRVLRQAAADLDALLDSVDRVASRFRPDSALRYANAHAGRPVPVPRLLADLVAAAQRMAAHTGGMVDPTVGRAVAVLGYDRDISGVAEDGPAVTPAAPARDWRSVRLIESAALLTVPAGTALDLGATAKAYTADLAAETLARRYETGVLVELGGDIAVAGPRTDGWCLRVAEAEGGQGDLIVLRHGGIATSTTTVRRWHRGGRPMHHIVDPRTGAPADGPWRTVTVAADDTLHANAASTGAIVLGNDALQWLDQHHHAARLVDRDGRVLTTAGWPAAQAVGA
jgi:thiamine biosynthesis lipoprotein